MYFVFNPWAVGSLAGMGAAIVGDFLLIGVFEMQVKELMSTRIETVAPDSTLLEAAKKMQAQDIGALPVGRDQGLVGMITDRDIAIRAVARGMDPTRTKVEEVMTREVFSCPAQSDVIEAVKLMEEKQVRRIVVSDTDDRPIGILSLGDLALHLRDEATSGEVLKEVSKPD
jgi:CBS domain-containing protein